jgi:hypothetical protein
MKTIASMIALATIALSVASPAQAQSLSSWEQAAANTCASRAHAHWPNAKVLAVATEGEYALCSLGDQNVGTEMLLRRHGSYYVYVGGGGGAMAPSDMETLYKVPASIAEPLVQKLNAALAAHGRS